VIFFGLKFFVKFVFEIKIIFFWNFFENPLKFNQKPLETHSHGFLSCARLTAQYHLRQPQKSRFDQSWQHHNQNHRITVIRVIAFLTVIEIFEKGD